MNSELPIVEIHLIRPLITIIRDRILLQFARGPERSAIVGWSWRLKMLTAIDLLDKKAIEFIKSEIDFGATEWASFYTFFCSDTIRVQTEVSPQSVAEVEI
jgi:hypothetical protein